VNGGWCMSQLVLKAGYYRILTSWHFRLVGHRVRQPEFAPQLSHVR
jgi:hypothetical protein